MLLARSRAARFDAGLVVDGLIGGVTVAAVAAEIGLEPLLHHTHMRLAGVAVDGVWLASDLAVLGIMAGCAALAASRGQRERWLLFAGAAVLAAADALSLYHSTATIAGLPGGWRQTLVPVAAVLMATAAIIPTGRARPTPARPVVGFTAVFALIAVTLQALDLIHATNPVAMALSVLVLLGVAMRVSLSFRSLRESEQLRVALLDAEEQRRMVLNQMLSAEADERARIAEELHDDTVQVLTATLVSLDRQRLSGDRGAYEAAAEAGQRARDTLALALERTRRLMFELRPPLLEAHGLAPAVRDLVEHANHELGLEVAVNVEVPRYAEAFETLVYRIVREAVANVRRHARARRLEVTLIQIDGELRGTIADDGLGFDVHRALDRHRTRMHLGLDATIERVRLAGGAIDIDSSPGEGTRLEFRLPSAGSEAQIETPDVVAVAGPRPDTEPRPKAARPTNRGQSPVAAGVGVGTLLLQVGLAPGIHRAAADRRRATQPPAPKPRAISRSAKRGGVSRWPSGGTAHLHDQQHSGALRPARSTVAGSRAPRAFSEEVARAVLLLNTARLRTV